MKPKEKTVRVKLNEADLARLRRVNKNSAVDSVIFLISQGVKHLERQSA